MTPLQTIIPAREIEENLDVALPGISGLDPIEVDKTFLDWLVQECRSRTATSSLVHHMRSTFITRHRNRLKVSA